MVLSDRFNGGPGSSLFKRTVLYVFGFGFGALAIAAIASFVLVSIAEGVLPAQKASPGVDEGESVNVIGDAPNAPPTPGSKARRARGNESPQPAEGGPI